LTNNRFKLVNEVATVLSKLAFFNHVISSETSSGRRPWAAKFLTTEPFIKSQARNFRRYLWGCLCLCTYSRSCTTSGSGTSITVALSLSSLACLSLVAQKGNGVATSAVADLCANLFVGIWFCNNWNSLSPPSGNLDP